MGIDVDDNLNVFLYKDGTFSLNVVAAQEYDNMFEKIIFYTNNTPIEHPLFNLSYQYISSPNKNNLFVYPNPIIENILSYSYFGDHSGTAITIKLIDLKGRIIFSKENQLDSYGNYNDNLSLEVSSGIYILQSVLDSGTSESKLITIIK